MWVSPPPPLLTGTIVDRFHKLREQSETAAKDEANVCFMCDASKRRLDLSRAGARSAFKKHKEEDHNVRVP